MQRVCSGGQSRLCRSFAGTAGGFPPDFPIPHRGIGDPTPPFHRQQCMLVSPKGSHSVMLHCSFGGLADGVVAHLEVIADSTA